MLQGITKWLQLTGQQAIIIGILYRLQEQHLPTNPVTIEKEYFKETKTFIQKSNLFSQLRLLHEKGLLIKNENAQYHLNLRGIQEALFSKKKELAQEVDEISTFASDTQAFFEKIVKPTSVSVTYLSETDLYHKLTFYLKDATAYYVGCDFPHYAYSFALCNSAQEAAYIEMLSTKIHDPAFSLFCISSYKIETLFYRLNQKYKNKELIKEELQEVIESVKKKTMQYGSIDLRKTTTPFNFALIENNEEGNVLFMFLKDSSGMISGGIFINSHETIKQTKQHFFSLMGATIPLKKESDFPKITDFSFTLPNVQQKKIVAFDVNRIFTVNHTTVELANLVGREKEVLQFIVKQIEGKLSMQEAILESAKLLKGLSVGDIEKLIPKVELIPHVKEGLNKLKEAGYYLVALSSGFSQIVTPICKTLGIDEIYCNVLEERDGKLTGEVLERNVLHDDVKYYIVKYLLERHSISEEKSIGVGDGFTDLPLLKATKLRICFNPSKKMTELYAEKDPAITHLVQGPDFMQLVKLILKTGPK